MTIPAGITAITVTGKFVDASGNPLAGYVIFKPSITAADATDNTIVPMTPVKVTLDGTGSFSVDLAATDDVTWTDPGWTYNVKVHIDVNGWTDYSFNMEVPAASSGGTLDLADVLAVDLPGTPSQYLQKSGGTMTGDIVLGSGVEIKVTSGPSLYAENHAYVVDGVVSHADTTALTYGYGNSVDPIGLVLPSYRASDDAPGGTDSTGRIYQFAYQRAGSYGFGEGRRIIFESKDAKMMDAGYYCPDGYDATTRLPNSSSRKPAWWAGGHWESTNHDGNHKHYEIEVADTTGALQGRFEILFGSQGNETIGIEKTLVMTNLADFVVRCSGTDSGSNPLTQQLRLSAAAGKRKDIQFANGVDGTTPRWTVGVNADAEAGSSAGSDFEVVCFNDSNAQTGIPIKALRAGNRNVLIGDNSSATLIAQGRVTIGSATANVRKLYVEDGTATNAVAQFKATAIGTATVAVQAVETSDATKRYVDFRVTGDNLPRVQFDNVSGNGAVELSDGTNARGVIQYDGAAALKSPGKWTVGGTFAHAGSNLGFFNTTPTTKPTVSGSRGSNAALASLLTGLASLGILTDSSS